MDNHKRKVLTEFIGECWHKPVKLQPWSCEKCHQELKDKQGNLISFHNGDLAHLQKLGRFRRTG
jgi:hypothetical protein